MQTFRRSVAVGPGGAPYKAKLIAGSTSLQFDADPPVTLPEPSYAVRLGLDGTGRRVALLATVAGDAITVNDAGELLGRWRGAGGYGWAAIAGRLVYVQDPPAQDSSTTTVRVFDVAGAPTGAAYPVSYSPMGILQIGPDLAPIMSLGAHASRTIDGIVFANPVTHGRVTVGLVEAYRRGGVGVKVEGEPVRMVQRTPWFDGYTNYFAEVLDRGAGQAPWIALQGSDKWSETPEPDEVAIIDYQALPDLEFVQPPRPVHLCPGDLVWGVDIEGDRWAYDLFCAGTPARILFHDARVALDAPITSQTGVVLLHDGETVTTLWLARKTGAAIWYYHDKNVDPDDVSQVAAWHAVLDTAVSFRDAYAIYIGVQGYPRLQPNLEAFDQLDAIYCIEKMLDDVRSRQLEAVLFTAVWQGNPVGNPPHLAYPEGILTRLLIELIPVINARGVVNAVVGFGEGRNNVSAWCLAFYRAWQSRLAGEALPAIRQTPVPVIVMPPPTPDPAPSQESTPTAPVGGRGGGSSTSSKPVTKKQKQVAGAAAAGGGILIAIGKLLHWW